MRIILLFISSHLAQNPAPWDHGSLCAWSAMLVTGAPSDPKNPSRIHNTYYKISVTSLKVSHIEEVSINEIRLDLTRRNLYQKIRQTEYQG